MTVLTNIFEPERRKLLASLVRKEHSHVPSHRVQFIRMEVAGTGYLVTYRLAGAFPASRVPDEVRVAFMHEDGIIWDRSTRFPDPGAG